MSIDRREVLDAVLVVLQAVEPSTDLAAPPGNPEVYGILQAGAGPLHDEGDQADTARHLVLRARLRTVVRHPDRPAAERLALDLAHRYEAALLDRSTPLAGSGWRVADRACLATSGTLAEGDVVNVVDDYELWVVPA